MIATVCYRERLSNLRANLSDLTGIMGSMFADATLQSGTADTYDNV